MDEVKLENCIPLDIFLTNIVSISSIILHELIRIKIIQYRSINDPLQSSPAKYGDTRLIY